MTNDELEKIEKAEEFIEEVERSRRRGLIDPIKDGVKLTKEYVDGLRNKVSEVRAATREDMESFRETMSVMRDTVIALRGSATKEDMENFRQTMKSLSEMMVTVRDTVESIRQTAETVREIMVMASMFKKGFYNARTGELPQGATNVEGQNTQKLHESVNVD